MFLRFYVFALAVLTAISSSIICFSTPLVGYLCPSCSSASNPSQLIENINEYYSTVNIAFIVWDENDGSIVNEFNNPSKKFYLTPSMISDLQSQGRDVFVSIGGGAGPTLDCSNNANSDWINTFTQGILNVTSTYGFNGVDFDIEHRTGDYVQCAYLVQKVMNVLSSKGLKLSIAPQMPNLYPDLSTVGAGFNELAPLISIVCFFSHCRSLRTTFACV